MVSLTREEAIKAYQNMVEYPEGVHENAWGSSSYFFCDDTGDPHDAEGIFDHGGEDDVLIMREHG